MDQAISHERARTRGASVALYRFVRVPTDIALRTYFRISRKGSENIPRSGPAIIACNHRSFLDPWVVGTMSTRPVHYVAKSELFRNPIVGRLLSALGAFPVRRGQGDQDTFQTAKELLARGELVLIFPEGTRTRPGPLGRPKRGVARLALETGVPVIPIAILGTEDVRKGVLIRPRKIRARAGHALEFEKVDHASPELANAVVARIWQSVSLLWEWLGGPPAPEPAEPSELVSAA